MREHIKEGLALLETPTEPTTDPSKVKLSWDAVTAGRFASKKAMDKGVYHLVADDPFKIGKIERPGWAPICGRVKVDYMSGQSLDSKDVPAEGRCPKCIEIAKKLNLAY